MDKDKEEITLEEIHGNELKTLIDFCYSGEIEISERNALALLQTASRLKFVTIERKCGDFLRKTLSLSNCLSIWAVIEPLLNFKELLKYTQTFVANKFVHIVNNSDEFLQLDADFLLILIRRDDLNVWSEEQVFNALVKWVQHDAESRKCHVPELLASIRWSQLKQRVSSFTFVELFQW